MNTSSSSSSAAASQQTHTAFPETITQDASSTSGNLSVIDFDNSRADHQQLLQELHVPVPDVGTDNTAGLLLQNEVGELCGVVLWHVIDIRCAKSVTDYVPLLYLQATNREYKEFLLKKFEAKMAQQGKICVEICVDVLNENLYLQEDISWWERMGYRRSLQGTGIPDQIAKRISDSAFIPSGTLGYYPDEVSSKTSDGTGSSKTGGTIEASTGEDNADPTGPQTSLTQEQSPAQIDTDGEEQQK